MQQNPEDRFNNLKDFRSYLDREKVLLESVEPKRKAAILKAEMDSKTSLI